MKIFITGASRGIGLFLLKKLTEKGHHVFGTYVNTQPPEEFKNSFSKIDITDLANVKSWIESLVEENDKIVLINSAGSNYNAIAHKADVDKWKKLIDINLNGTFNAIHSVLPFMRENKYGRIINLSSIVAQNGIPGTSAYAASKSAFWGLSKSVSREVATKGVTINNLNLGYFNIGMISEVPDKILEGIKASIPMQKLGDPNNILNAIEFLINSDYITGTSIDINGGLF